MNYAIEETKDVKRYFKNSFMHVVSTNYFCSSFPCARTLPLSLFIGIPLVAISYLLVNFSFFATLTYSQILQSDAVALVSIILFLQY